MDKETKAQIMADINALMEKDKADKEFLTELLEEMQEAYQEDKMNDTQRKAHKIATQYLIDRARAKRERRTR